MDLNGGVVHHGESFEFEVVFFFFLPLSVDLNWDWLLICFSRLGRKEKSCAFHCFRALQINTIYNQIRKR